MLTHTCAKLFFGPEKKIWRTFMGVSKLFPVVSLFLKYFISDILLSKLGEISKSLILNLSQRLLPDIV